ncbi:MIT domain-containing protein 1-like [Periplaneta americana]|uniref:MIT domain-containing protein 1-like n=1 Tax=Periplaneta americana TaxID=6978 RepID=UPI0037E91579
MSASGLETAAVTVLKNGVDMDNKKRYTEALVCYREGLELLLNVMKGVADPEKKKHLRSKVEAYMARAEKLKVLIEEQKALGKYHEEIIIENDSTGHSYRSLFGRFLDEDVTTIEVEDPYIRSFHQCQNFLRFCELAVKSCCNLKTIQLTTSTDGSVRDQTQWLEMLRQNLQRYRINLIIEFSSTLHDRQIKLSSGWIIKIGRGLDYFKAPENKLSLGFFEMDFRPCHETTVNIFHTKDVKKSYA